MHRKIEMASDNSAWRGDWTTDPGHRDQDPGAVGSRPATSVAARESDIRITLPARPENVAVVRQVIGAFAEVHEVPRAVAEDMRLAVTEACTNVVRHAYSDGGGNGDGTIEVVVRRSAGALELIVADNGRGIGRSPDTAGPGLGLALIAALTDSLEIQRSASAGSRLVMSFLRTRTTPALA